MEKCIHFNKTKCRNFLLARLPNMSILTLVGAFVLFLFKVSAKSSLSL